MYKRPSGARMASDPVEGQYKDKTIDEVLVLAESRDSKEQASTSLPSAMHFSAGSHIMAQVLGFKFAYYQVRGATRISTGWELMRSHSQVPGCL